MKLAKILNTDELFEAEELRFISKNDMPKFVCPDNNCNTPLIPAAYSDDSKQRPHFRTLKNHKHAEKCQFSEYAQFLEIGGKRKFTLAEFENLPIPTKLVAPKANTKPDKIRSSKENEELADKSATKRGYLNAFDEGSNNWRSVTTISRIVDFYIACPFNRDIKLDLFGTEKEYRYWFKRIQNIRGERIKDKNIFFGQLHQDKNAIEYSDTNIKIRLYDCREWVGGNQINPYYVIIPIAGLTKNKIARIKNEIKNALLSQREYYQTTNSNIENNDLIDLEKSKQKPYIFFVGNQTKKNPFELEVQDGYLVSRYERIRKTETN
jgi:hypothetical protein